MRFLGSHGAGVVLRRAAVGALVVSVPSIALIAGATPASAAVNGLCGKVAVVPGSLATALQADTGSRTGRASDAKAIIVPEKTSVTVPDVSAGGLPIDAVTPGTYDDFPLLTPTARITAGTVVDSYLFHTDPVGSPAVSKDYDVTVRFTQPIVGVVVQSQRLYNGSSTWTPGPYGDALFGNGGTAYTPIDEQGPEGNATLRGLEILASNPSPPDSFTIVDQYTIRFQLKTSVSTDEARIFTAAAAAPGANAEVGYRMVARDGGIFAYGANSFWGSLPATNPNVTNIVGAANYCEQSQGYWFAGSDGAVYNFGSSAAVPAATPKAGTRIVAISRYFGSQGVVLFGNDGSVYGTGSVGSPLFSNTTPSNNNPGVTDIIGGAVSPDGAGYWLVDVRGKVYAYGVPDYGSVTFALNAPVVGMAMTPSGEGYYLLAKDGGVFSYGDAAGKFFGSTGSITLNAPVTGMQVTPSGEGYYLVAEDGGIFAYGDAVFVGSVPGSLAPGQKLNQPVVGMF